MSHQRPCTRQASNKQPADGPSGAAESLPSPNADNSSPSNADLQRDIADFSNRILIKLDNIDIEIKSINRRLTDVETTVEFNSAKIVEVETAIPTVRASLQDEISDLKEKLLLMEIYNRKQNLLFYGVEEQREENIYKTLLEVFILLGVDEKTAQEINLINAHRLPRRNDPPDHTTDARSGPTTGRATPAPIIAKFIKMTDRDLILSTFENIKRPREALPLATAAAAANPPPTSRITVRTDLPPTLKARRGHLASVAYKLRKEKNLATRIKMQGVKIVLQWKEKGTSTWKPYKE